jgi:hypothetical protein
MNLVNKENFENIENCPLENESGEKELYRCVFRDRLEESFVPLALEKAKYKDNCLAWGLSVFKGKDIAIQKLKNLSKKKSMDALAIALINDTHGLKHQSGGDINHYTFYPADIYNCIEEFKIVEDDE